jgi:hypothetical protein
MFRPRALGHPGTVLNIVMTPRVNNIPSEGTDIYYDIYLSYRYLTCLIYVCRACIGWGGGLVLLAG